MAIHLFAEGVKSPKHKTIIKRWVKEVVQHEGYKTGDINIIFCTDEYLLKINQDFLQHDYFTDIITFDYSSEGLISGELFVSYDRIHENALLLSTGEQTELLRVIIHGIYHLCGYADVTKDQRLAMTDKENEGLKLWERIRGESPGNIMML